MMSCCDIWRLIGRTTYKHNYIYCIQYPVYICVRVSGQAKIICLYKKLCLEVQYGIMTRAFCVRSHLHIIHLQLLILFKIDL
jgi:hypothetical protein